MDAKSEITRPKFDQDSESSELSSESKRALDSLPPLDGAKTVTYSDRLCYSNSLTQAAVVRQPLNGPHNPLPTCSRSWSRLVREPSRRERFASAPWHQCDQAVNGGVLDQDIFDSTLGYPGEGPLTIIGKLGDLRYEIMIDSGSDYDAINLELAQAQSLAKNPGFIRRQTIEGLLVGGFAAGQERACSTLSSWTLTLCGTRPSKRNLVSLDIVVEFHEFTGSSHPLVLGLPFIDERGGLEIFGEYVGLMDIYVDRFFSLAPGGASTMQYCIGTVLALDEFSSGEQGPVIDDKGWYLVDFVINDVSSLPQGTDAVWVEETGISPDLQILETSVNAENWCGSGPGVISVLVTCNPGKICTLRKGEAVLQLRPSTADDLQIGACLSSVVSGRIAAAAKNSYKARGRTDNQAKHFDELLAEIEQRRANFNQHEFIDQSAPQFVEHLKDIVRASFQTKPMIHPEFFEEFAKRILEPFSCCFWTEGCAAPSIKGYHARIERKPGYEFKNKQPYSLSKFDQARLSYLIEEEEREGKIERLGPNDPRPPCVTPVFMVDKKGSLIGRRVGAYQFLNEGSLDYYHPAPDADAILVRATGRAFHSVLDCVWGFSGLDTDEETSLLCAIITHCGAFKTKKLGYGPKQGPALYQAVQNDIFADEFKNSGEALADIFIDDTHIGDDTVPEHVASLCQLFRRARTSGVQYRFSKCVFFMASCLLLGFEVGVDGRRADPAKIEQLKNWPAYQSNADIVSHLFFASYLREFLGPDFVPKTDPLAKYRKQGASFDEYEQDTAAHAAREWLLEVVVEKAVMRAPNWLGAARPWKSGCPFILFIDASDKAWCAALTQPREAGGPPMLIGFVCRAFADVARRWSAFERELFGFRGGYLAVARWVEGFPLFFMFDHKNVERAESVFKSRRAAKKLLAWVADSQVMLQRCFRIWIDGKSNVLSDAGSRGPWASVVAKRLPLPLQPVLDTIRDMFSDPTALGTKVQARNKEMSLPPWKPCSFEPEELRWLQIEDESTEVCEESLGSLRDTSELNEERGRSHLATKAGMTQTTANRVDHFLDAKSEEAPPKFDQSCKSDQVSVLKQ